MSSGPQGQTGRFLDDGTDFCNQTRLGVQQLGVEQANTNGEVPSRFAGCGTYERGRSNYFNGTPGTVEREFPADFTSLAVSEKRVDSVIVIVMVVYRVFRGPRERKVTVQL